MTAFRMTGLRGIMGEAISPGDSVLSGDLTASVPTVGSTTLTAAQIVSGNIFRSGSGAGYTDTFDTTGNVLNALGGNLPGGAIVNGLSLKLRIVNTVAFAETITLPNGYVTGLGTVASVAASTWRDFLLTFTNTQPPVSNVCNTTSGSAVVTWNLPVGQPVQPIGVSPLAINIMPGCSVSGPGVPANTTVLSVQQGQGGSVGFTMSANATITGIAALTFQPVITVNSLGSGPL
jgi:hypothetical protein